MTAKTNTASSQAEELRALLDRASKAIEEKRRVAGAIQALESQIAQAQERLQTATNRKEAEEFEAAQREGGAAVASDAVCKAVSEAELSLKTLQLKLRGVRPKAAEPAARIAAIAEEHAKLRTEVHQRQVDELRAAFTAACGQIKSLICQGLALSHHLSSGEPASLGFYPVRLAETVVADPFGMRPLLNGLFLREGAQLFDLSKEWHNDPAAAALDRELLQYAGKIEA
ncbi:MAG: hypothetical protein ABSH46_08865 [Bryobacteraceae bacterium]